MNTQIYRRGLDWFPTLDPTWKDIIGVIEVDLVQTGCICNFVDDPGRYQIIESGVSNCESIVDGFNECWPIIESHTNTLPSDGFISAQSAMSNPGATYEPREMNGSNHLQMRNDINTRDAMDAIFNGGLGRNYFRTNPR